MGSGEQEMTDPTPTPSNPRDWPEDFSHENGNYFCRCCMCGNQFTGYKRRVVCKQCSTIPPKTKTAEDYVYEYMQMIGLNDDDIKRAFITEPDHVNQSIDFFQRVILQTKIETLEEAARIVVERVNVYRGAHLNVNDFGGDVKHALLTAANKLKQ
jgi:hypothetical protein